MNFDVHQMPTLVPESYSRLLDERVARSEMPYGYTNEPPPADTGDFNQRSLESDKQYQVSGGKIRR